MKKLLFALVVCALASSAWATVEDWKATIDSDWGNPLNWAEVDPPLGNPGHVPTIIDKVAIRSGVADAVIGPLVAAVGQQFVIGDWGSLADTVVVNGGSYTSTVGGAGVIGSWTILGYGATNNGTLRVNSGSMDLGEHLFVGFMGVGNLDINGGAVNVLYGMFAPGWMGGSGNIHLDGGVLHTAQWWGGAGFLGTHNYTFDITGGEWILNSAYDPILGTWHGWEAELQTLVDNGWITGYGGEGQVVLETIYDEMGNPIQVHATAIPEPVTISLLGLGALALLRRRS